MREDLIHLAVRRFLTHMGWQLIAGQFPDGSDEIPPLNVVDPILAHDNSPDHRRHSMNKFVPDLVACRGRLILIIEMKPDYSFKDEKKLQELLTSRRPDLITALKALISKHKLDIPIAVEELSFIPCLGFEHAHYTRNPLFCYFRVKDLASVTFDGNEALPNL